MKKLLSVLFIALLLLSKTFLMAQTQLRAGAARVNITPSIGTVINGDFLPMYAKSIHDSLFVKALAFDNGKQRVVFIVVDCMAIDGQLLNEAKNLIQASTGLKEAQVMISSTHAHSCGAVTGGSVCPPDLAYRLAMPQRINRAAVLAFSKLQPAKIAWGHIDVPKFVSCRRWYMKPGFEAISPFGDKDKVWMNPVEGSEFLDRPVSPTDPQVSYLAVKTMKDKWISIMANYSIHYAADVPGNTISADYFGEFDKQIKAKLSAGGDFVGIMSNGTSGDVNTTDFRLERNYPTEPFGKSKLIANDVADSIILSLKKAKFEAKPIINFKLKEVVTGTRKPSETLVKVSTEKIANLDFSTLNSTDKASNSIANLYALHVIELNEYHTDFIKLPVQAIRIGEGTIGTLPGEIFSETGLKLKKAVPAKYYFTVSLANAYVGYIPPATQLKLGGYETWLCTTSHMEENAEEKLAAALLLLAKSVQ